MTVEDTLKEAVNIGQKMFGIKPALILILLPGNGTQLLVAVMAARCATMLCLQVLVCWRGHLSAEHAHHRIKVITSNARHIC